jgi:hypothetical protein
MWEVPDEAIGRAITPDQGIITDTHFTGVDVYATGLGYADFDHGRVLFRDGLEFVTEVGVLQALRSGDESRPTATLGGAVLQECRR